MPTNRLIKHVQSQIQTGVIIELPLVVDGRIYRHGWIELQWRDGKKDFRSGINILLHVVASGIMQIGDKWISLADKPVHTEEDRQKIESLLEQKPKEGLQVGDKVEFVMSPNSTVGIEVYQPLMVAYCVSNQLRRIATRKKNGDHRRIFSKHQPCGSGLFEEESPIKAINEPN